MLYYDALVWSLGAMYNAVDLLLDLGHALQHPADLLLVKLQKHEL